MHSTGPTTNRSAALDGRRAEELFRTHHDRIVRLLQGRLGVSRELAEDACGLAWLQLLRVRPNDGDRIVGWLYTVAKHEAFALLARAGREIGAEDLPLAATISGFDDIIEARDALRLIAQLKPQQRLVLLLRAEGYSYKAICDLTGQTYTWVNRHISEGRKALRLLVERQ